MWTVAIIIAVLGACLGALQLLDGGSFRIFPTGDKEGIITLFRSHALNAQEKQGSWDDQVKNYDEQFERHQKGEADGDTSLVDYYYNMATDFYEYGWGTSFHFAHTYADESHEDSIARHEHRLADAMKLTKGKLVLDAGCGVGGPAREIARYSGAKVVGVTLNDYQVGRAKKHTLKEGMTNEQVEFHQMDYTKLTFADETFDNIYTIESTCHAPTLQMVFKELYRVLKPGGEYTGYHWIAAKDYDASSEAHQKIMRDIEYGDGLPPLRTLDQLKEAAAEVGFELISEVDLAQDKEGTRPWYQKLDFDWWRHALTDWTCWMTELVGLAPKGTLSMHGVLLHAAKGLVEGGKQNCFTPMHLVHLRKPL